MLKNRILALIFILYKYLCFIVNIYNIVYNLIKIMKINCGIKI